MLASPLPMNSVSTSMIDNKKKNKQKSTYHNETTQHTLTSMGLISSFSISTSTSTPLLSASSSITTTTTTKKNSNKDDNTISNKANGSLHIGTISDHATNNTRRKPSELKFKIESIGVQPEEDDDLDTCPARTRAIWPQQLIPWWQPSHPKDRPPYPYSTLIAYAILVSQDGRLLLSDIYKWISDTYPYYSLNNRGWQNSIRHNLSLYKRWFLKVDRRPTQANPGKGCYWTLVPGTEQMFMDNITEAGGHSRKHHDIGLTKELSMGHHNHLLINHPIMSTNSNHHHTSIIPSSSSSSSSSSVNKSNNSNNNTSGTGGINPTFSHTNMKIILPEDYQQQENTKKNNSTTSSSSNINDHSNNNNINNNNTNDKKNDSALSKSSKKKPDLNPTFGSFRITSSNNQESTKRSFDKTMINQDVDDQAKKRMKLDVIDINYEVDPLNGGDDDSRSDCDSGIDVNIKHLQGHNKDTGKMNNKMITSNGLVLDKDEIELYSVLDDFLENLPIPSTNTVTMFDHTSTEEEENNHPVTSITMLPFNLVENMNEHNNNNNNNNNNALPIHPLDNDPILGYPSWQYYSTDGFYLDTMETNDMTTLPMTCSNTDGDDHHFHQSTYPNVLTSSFEPNLSTMMLNMDDTNDPFEKLNGPIVIHLNSNQHQHQQHHPITITNTMANEEMTDEFLRFDDDFITSHLDQHEIENDNLDPSLLLSDGTTSDTFTLNMSTMCSLMEA